MDTLTDDSARRRRLAAILRLGSVPGLGRARAARWIRSEGGVAGALARAEREVAPPEFDVPAARAALRRMLAACVEHEIRTVLPDEPDYPADLERLADPPELLFLRGRPAPPGTPAVAVVGSRGASAYGLRVARDLGRALGSAGVRVVSGMALGIDAAAHRGALEGGGRSDAVMGRGLDAAYPARHRRLMERLAEHGALWSEYAPGAGPRKHHFPERNRLIAGMVDAVVVVEAAKRSGALVTARLGLEAGTDVWAVPGQIDTDTAAGVHALLRDGARPVCSVAEVVDSYAPDDGVRRPTEPTGISTLAAEVWTHLARGAANLDQLAARWTGDFPGAGPVLAALAELEVGGWIARAPDASWVRRAA